MARVKTPKASPVAAACLTGENVAAIMLSCCSAHGANDPAHLPPSAAGSDLSEREAGPRRGSNLWSERLSTESRGEVHHGSGSGSRGSSPSVLTQANDDGAPPPRGGNNIGASELIGLALPCGRHHGSSVGDRASRGGGRSGRPFASNPLVDRGDSLAEDASMVSLIASETMEQHAPATPRNGRRTPPPKAGQQQKKVNEVLRTPPPRRVSSGMSLNTPDSPALELSMAKQVANAAQMTNVRMHNREMLRSYRSPGANSVGSASPDRSHRSTMTPLGEKSEKAHGGVSNDSASHSVPETTQEKDSNPSSDAKDDNNNPSNDVTETETVTVQAHSYYVDRKTPPLWGESDGANSELASTYQYPRLYLQDPSRIIEHGEETAGGNPNPWWFRVAQRMETTLCHVRDDHWKALMSKQPSQNSGLCVGESISASSSTVHDLPLGCDATPAEGCNAMRNLCLGQQQPRIPPQGTAKMHRKSSSWSSFGSKSKTKTKKGTAASGGAGDGRRRPAAAASSPPSASPVNAWSEPAASTMKVRGPTYTRDGVKVQSESSMFSVVGVDSFVAGKGGIEDDDPSWATDSFVKRWMHACEEVGLDAPPFLLIFNFLCPWGNFQTYLARPDADEGPFSSHHKHRPSEKALRRFVDGSTEYRNQRLKLIPRVVAGPWMVKKMVGSTPALIGTKLPVSYRGSVEDNYLEITLHVSEGPAFGNSVANTVVGKADAVTVDLGFVIEGNEKDGHLPEQMLGLVRLHHLDMASAPTHSKWKQKDFCV